MTFFQVFPDALIVTAVTFASVSIRFIPFHWCCGRRIADSARSCWYWVFLASVGFFLARELWRFPDPTKRMPDSFRVSLPFYVNVPAHIAVWISYALIVNHLWKFRLLRITAVEVVDLQFDVMLLPIVFGLLALHCIRILPDRYGRDLWSATSTLDAAEMWESWALWSFQSLIIRHAEDSKSARSPLYSAFESLCSAGVRQYVAFNFISNLLEFAWRAADRFDPAMCGKLWGHAMTCEEEFQKTERYLIGALWYSCSIAIYSILRFEHALATDLKEFKPFWKFWGAKIIVSVAGVQRLILFSLTKLGLVSEVFGWYLHAYFLCFETLFLTMMHFWAYPPTGHFKTDRFPLPHSNSPKYSVLTPSAGLPQTSESSSENCGVIIGKPACEVAGETNTG